MSSPSSARSLPTTGDLLQRSIVRLRMAGINDASLEAELLLRHALGLDKTAFYLRRAEPLSDSQRRACDELVAQRLTRRPVAYITGRREFYDLDLHVAPGVLIPRPETELLVDHALRLLRERLRSHGRALFVDVGTGSGAIALTVAKHLPAVDVLALDRSPAALTIAAYNARRLRLAGRVRFVESDLLSAVQEPIDLLAANLPYIPSAEIATLQPEVRDFEPRLALDGGADGLTLIRALIGQLRSHLLPGGIALLELGQNQGAAVRQLAAEQAYAATELHVDLAGHERLAVLHC